MLTSSAVVGLLEVAQIPIDEACSQFILHAAPPDIDLIVLPTVGQLRGFLQSLPASDYYVSGPEAPGRWNGRDNSMS
jgi:hypothetical protein